MSKAAATRAIRRESTDTTLYELNDNFAGRIGDSDYDETKLVHIHRRNRPLVWSHVTMLSFLDSLLKGYYIPPIICSSSFRNGNEIREVMDGGNRITTIRRILDNSVRELTPEERRRVETSKIAIVLMYNLTPCQTREMFCRINKSFKVTDGQLYAMSEDDSPLVCEAIALLEDDAYPLREMITLCFFDTRNNDDAKRRNLANAVAMISGITHGPKYITTKFSRQEEHVENPAPIDRERIVAVLSQAFHIFREADTCETKAPSKAVKKARFNIERYLAPIIYDILTVEPDDILAIQEKWVDYIGLVRNQSFGASDAMKVPGKSKMNADTWKRISYKVFHYVKGGPEYPSLTHDYLLKDMKYYLPASETDVKDEDEDEENEEEVDEDI